MNQEPSIEFYFSLNHVFEQKIYVRWDIRSQWLSFDELTPIEIEHIFSRCMKDHKAKMALLHLSREKFNGDKAAALKQFIMCNWTEIDQVYDITPSRLNFERVPCPFKSTQCPFRGKGLVCIKP